MSTPVSQQWFDRALAVSPGGVNSPVRAFRAVGGTPRFMTSARGPWLTDADGQHAFAFAHWDCKQGTRLNLTP